MRISLSLGAVAIISTISSLAFAHGGQTIDHDRGAGLLWFYAIALVVIVGFVGLRIYLRSTRPAGQQRLSRHIAELEDILASNLAKLRDAEKYPAESGLSAKDRQTTLDAVATIQRLIEEEELKLASAQNDAQSVAT